MFGILLVSILLLFAVFGVLNLVTCVLSRSALEKKKAEENKDYQAIDYDAPVDSDKRTIGFGTRVGIYFMDFPISCFL